MVVASSILKAAIAISYANSMTADPGDEMEKRHHSFRHFLRCRLGG